MYPYAQTQQNQVPIVPPMTHVPPSVPTYATLLPAGAPEVPGTAAPPIAPAVPAPQDAALAAQKRLLKWGTVGVLLGAGANVVVTALAFKSYHRTKSIWKPALWAGAGSIVIGGTLLWVLAHSVNQQLDQRVVAATIGAKLAV